METTKVKGTKVYLIAMCVYWFVFGLILIFYPKMVDMFQTETGVAARTAYSNHVLIHDGLDIIALCVILFALSRETVSRNLLRATAVAALMPTIAITYSLVATPYWKPLFIIADLGCFAFVIWGFVLAAKTSDKK